MSRIHRKYPRPLQDQRPFFDERVAEEWNAYESRDWDRSRRYEVRRLFRNVSPRTVLNVGCGVGFQDVEMAKRPGVSSVLGIDFSPKSIEVAQREYGHPHVQRQVADIRSAELGLFDLVVSFEVIEHVVDPAEFMRLCASHARPGGWVAVVTPNWRRLMNRLLPLLRRPPVLGDPQHFFELTQDDLSRLGREAGLVQTDAFSYGLTVFVPRLGWQLIPQRIAPQLGATFAPVADKIGAVFRKP